MELPKRKPNRLKNYDYSQNGAYFVTICVKNRCPILAKIHPSLVGASTARPHEPMLTDIGKVVDDAIRAISDHYPNVKIDNYVIMPNHIHMILSISCDTGRAMLAPTTLPRIIQQMKGFVTKRCGQSIWQKSYYDHIIRTEKDYLEIWQYIDENPYRWCNDELVMDSP